MVTHISFGSKFKGFILDSFNKKTDKEGYVVEKDSGQRVITPEGLEFKKEEFGGIKNGSEIYFKTDLLSLIRLCDELSK